RKVTGVAVPARGKVRAVGRSRVTQSDRSGLVEARAKAHREAHLIERSPTCDGSSSFICSRSRSVTNRRSREFSSWSSAIRVCGVSSIRLEPFDPDGRLRQRCSVMTLTPSARAISLCSFPCVTRSSAPASLAGMAATTLTRPNRSAQRLPCGRHSGPTAKTVGQNNVVTNLCVERGDHLTHHRHDDDLRLLSGGREAVMERLELRI